MQKVLDEPRRLSRLLEDPLKRAFEPLETYRLLTTPNAALTGVESASRVLDLPAAARSVTDALASFRAVSQVMDSLRQTTESVQVFEEVDRMTQAFRPYAVSLDAMVATWHAAARSLDAALAIGDTFGGRLLDQLASVQQFQTEDDLEESLDGLVELIRKEAAALHPSPAARIGLLLTIVSIVIALWALARQYESEESARQRFLATQSRLIQIETKLEEAAEPAAEAISSVYFTTALVNLRAGASTESPVLARVQPNSLVAELSCNGLWLKVEVYDFVESSVQAGWIYKRYLKRLRTDSPAQLIAELESEAAWSLAFESSEAALEELAKEALDEHRRGETQELDPESL